MTITPLYAGVLTLLYLALSFRVIGMRRKKKIGLGHGDNKSMLRRIRAHANFAEYVPLALVLMALLELQNKSDWIIHLLGGLLIVGRTAHAIGLTVGSAPARVLGMILTFAALITGAAANLGLSATLASLSN